MKKDSQATIYTFYSYKGGVGRSMALVNIAELMYRAGLRVIIIDWDLEAPGLERFFSSEKIEEALHSPGVIDMLIAYKAKASRLVPGEQLPFSADEIENYLIDVYEDDRLLLLPAGYRAREQFFEYANRVKTFDWKDFYDNWEGEVYFEWLREQLAQMADAILIDSRTGVTEMGGVCTYQLADVIVMFCAANTQNIDGTLQMMLGFSDPRLPELRSGRDLNMLVVPARVEKFSEIPRLNEFRERFAESFASHLSPELARKQDFLVHLEIPYVAAYAFEETVAVKQTGRRLRSVELEEAYTTLLEALRDLAPHESAIRERLQDMARIFPAIAQVVEPPTAPLHYISAKMILVGDSGVGKSGLATRLAESRFRPTESTHGTRFWHMPVPDYVTQQLQGLPNVQAELSIWDLGGQLEYRLTHQLFLDDVDVALLLFDCSDHSDPFHGVPYWATVLKKQAPSRALKYLVSARADVSPVTVSQARINQVLAEYEIDGYFCTSAKTGDGVDSLVQHVFESIPWAELPRTTVPRLFQVVREFLIERREDGDNVLSVDEILRETRQRYMTHEVSRTEIDTTIDLLQAQGLVQRLEPTPRLAVVLLQPDLITQYASSIILAARSHPRGMGAVAEREIISGELPITGFERLDPLEEKPVLEATIELLIQHDLCFREMGQLVFPSQLTIRRPDTGDYPPSEVTYSFSGSVEAIYASLVVRLSHAGYFQREDQWKYAAEFSRGGHRMGFFMQQVEEGTSKLEIYFHPDVDNFDRVTFIRFITDHLRAKSIDVEEHFRIYCQKCGNEVENRTAIAARVALGKLDVPCQYCDASIVIPQSIEQIYASDRSYVEKQRELAEMVEDRTRRKLPVSPQKQQQYTEDVDQPIHILHLSDIHLGTAVEARKYRTQLETDLIHELQVNRLDYLIISGDIGTLSTPDEYKAAFELVDGLVKRFGLDSSRLIVVPGNHDLNWDLARNAYHFVFKDDPSTPLVEGRYIPAGDEGILVRDEERYQQRFSAFSAYFYKRISDGTTYPLDYAEQAIVHLHPDDQCLFLALNSAWEIDHVYRDRASINMDALARALEQLKQGEYDDWLKIAVWHHPVTGLEMMSGKFMEQLALAGFQIVLHGHIHESIEGFHTYDRKRGLYSIGAGTFGAPTREQSPGIPLQYNLLILDPQTRTLTVETRKKEKIDGAWSADARWGDKNNPVPRYSIQLR